MQLLPFYLTIGLKLIPTIINLTVLTGLMEMKFALCYGTQQGKKNLMPLLELTTEVSIVRPVLHTEFVCLVTK